MNNNVWSVPVAFLLSTIPLGCMSSSTNSTPETQRAYDSLNYLYYMDNPAPPEPSAVEKQAASVLLDSMQEKEKEFLDNRFGDDLVLIAYALRDTDKDGLVDYRVNSDSRFIENDTDVDGDGVFNVRDAQPYDSSVTYKDENGNNVPDHIDWEDTDDKKEYAKYQIDTLDEFDIIMVERDSKFTEELAKSNYDLVKHLFWPLYNRLGSEAYYPDTYPALKTMASASRADHSVSLDEQSTLADMSGINATITYYDLLDKDPGYKTLMQLQVMAHELAHGVEFSMDTYCDFPVDTTTCKSEAFLRKKKNNVYYARNYYKFVEEAGWTVKKTGWDKPDEPLAELTESYSCKHIFYHVADQDCYYVPYTEQYGDKSSAQWAEALTEIWNTLDHEPYFAHALLRDNYLPGDYAATESWEWFAEYGAHYMLMKINDAAATICESEGKTLGGDFIYDVQHELSADFNNIRGNQKALDLIAPLFAPGDENSWEILAKDYLFKDYPDICE